MYTIWGQLHCCSAGLSTCLSISYLNSLVPEQSCKPKSDCQKKCLEKVKPSTRKCDTIQKSYDKALCTQSGMHCSALETIGIIYQCYMHNQTCNTLSSDLNAQSDGGFFIFFTRWQMHVRLQCVQFGQFVSVLLRSSIETDFVSMLLRSSVETDFLTKSLTLAIGFSWHPSVISHRFSDSPTASHADSASTRRG